MCGILMFLLFCYSPLATLAAWVPRPSSVAPWLPSDDKTSLNSLNISNSLSISNSFNSSTLASSYPHRFDVPDTDVYLRMSLGFVRRRLDPNHLRALLVVAEDFIDEHMANLPPAPPHLQHIYPTTAGGRQQFHKTLGDGISLEIENHWILSQFFTWDELRDVVVGLRLYLVDGGRSWQTKFRFYNGDFAPTFTGRFLGSGKLTADEFESDEERETELTADWR